MSSLFQDISNRETWDNFVTSRPEANFLQSFDFGEFHISRGKKVLRRAVVQNGKVLAAYTGVIETAKRGKYLAIAGGPILDWSNKSLVKSVFADIRSQATKESCVFVRVRPQLEKSSSAERLFQRNGLKPAPMYLSVEHAGILDLSKTEEEIVANMRQRLRRALRKAEKAGITVETSTDPRAIKEFYKIQLQTAQRQKFIVFSEDFLEKQFAAFAKNNEAILYIAKKDGEILAENFMIFYGNEASYHYGVSTELGTKLSGAPLLHMTAMREARGRGIKRYNFWGIVDEEDAGHRFYGVSVFKRGFGVQDLKYLPAHDMVLKPLPYLFNWTIETIRRKARRV
jgi:lipid II:glycine glycyltransferase (peptidoglycan interpeptide bridge formation enzyme)